MSCLFFIISGASVPRSVVGSDTNRYGAGSECDERRPQRDRVQLASPVTPQNSHWQCSYTQILRESVKVRSKRVRCRHKRWLLRNSKIDVSHRPSPSRIKLYKRQRDFKIRSLNFVVPRFDICPLKGWVAMSFLVKQFYSCAWSIQYSPNPHVLRVLCPDVSRWYGNLWDGSERCLIGFSVGLMDFKRYPYGFKGLDWLIYVVFYAYVQR